MSCSSQFFAFVAVFALLVGSQNQSQNQVHADEIVLAPTTGIVCPKCGIVHAVPSASPIVQTNSPVVQTSYAGAVATSSMPSPTPRISGGGVTNVLSALNAQRARWGVGQLGFDPQLQAVAERRAQMMATSGNKSHPPGSFSPGRYEGVGWSSSHSPSGVSACYTNDSRMRVAGAAMATGRDGVYFAVVYR